MVRLYGALLSGPTQPGSGTVPAHLLKLIYAYTHLLVVWSTVGKKVYIIALLRGGGDRLVVRVVGTFA